MGNNGIKGPEGRQEQRVMGPQDSQSSHRGLKIPLKFEALEPSGGWRVLSKASAYKGDRSPENRAHVHPTFGTNSLITGGPTSPHPQTGDKTSRKVLKLEPPFILSSQVIPY